MNRKFSDVDQAKRLVAGFVGLAVGQLIGDKAVTLAKGILWVFGDPLTNQVRIAEGALLLIMFLMVISAVTGIVAVQRRRLYAEALLLGVVVGAFTGLFVIVDYGLTVEGETEAFRVGQALYYFGWCIGLWLLPVLVLPNPGGTVVGKVLRGYGMFAVAGVMTIIGIAGGLAIEHLVKTAGLQWFADVAMAWDSPEELWVARPFGMNAVCGSLVVVASAPMWWHGLRWPRPRLWLWTLGITTIACVYSGLWGAFFYRGGDDCPGWCHAQEFSVLPAIGVCAVALVYVASPMEGEKPNVGWGVTARFWRLLPAVFGLSCALNAAISLAPIEGYVNGERWILAGMHFVNGSFLGGSLWATVGLFGWIPADAQGPYVPR